MIGNIFLRALSLAMPALVPMASTEPSITNLPALSTVVQVRAGAPLYTEQDLYDPSGPASVPVVLVTEAQGAREEVRIQLPLDAQLVPTVEEAFDDHAVVVLRNVEAALLKGTKSKLKSVRQASYEVLPAVRQQVPYQLSSGILMPVDVEVGLSGIAERAFGETGRRVVVTSGTRTPERQAAAMKTKLDLGESPRSLYHDKKSAGEIENAYRWARGAGLSGNTVVDAMAQVIQSQIDSGIYISRHLRSGAVDLRSRDLSSGEKSAIVRAAKAEGASIQLETTPPHFHIDLDVKT